MRLALLLAGMVVAFYAGTVKADNHEPRAAVIRLDEAGAIWVKQHDDSWLSWINGAPDFVNREFNDRYVSVLLDGPPGDGAFGPSPTPTATPTPTPTPEPTPPPRAATVEIGWWVLELAEDGDDTAIVRSERFHGSSVNRETLRLACRDGTFSVSTMIDRDGEPWLLRNPRNPNGISTLNEMGLPPAQAGQILVRIYIDGAPDLTYAWWNIAPGYLWAFAPDPHAFVDSLRGAHSLGIGLSLNSRSDRPWPHNFPPSAGELPVAGIDDVLARMSCLP